MSIFGGMNNTHPCTTINYYIRTLPTLDEGTINNRQHSIVQGYYILVYLGGLTLLDNLTRCGYIIPKCRVSPLGVNPLWRDLSVMISK